MEKKLSRDKYRAKLLSEEIQNNVCEDPDYKRHLKEVARETGMPEDVVSRVLSNFFFQIPKIFYSNNHRTKRVSFLGFFHLDFKKRFFNKNINNNDNK